MRNDDDFGELLEQLDLELYLDSEGIDYRLTSGRNGEQINVKTCPRCNGNEWKVYLNRETGLGNCFHGSCVGEPGFNKYSFIQHYTGEVNKVVVDIIKDQLKESGWRPKVKKSVTVEVPANLELPESEALCNNNKLDYLAKRGFDTALVEHFHLRYCNKGFYPYTDQISGEKKYQPYHKRVIIPIFDIDGKMVTFQGRDTTGEAKRKYLFPPMLPSTARYLYNLHDVLGKSHLIIGEGVFDVMALHKVLSSSPVMSGYGAVGSFGIEFSTGQESQLEQLQIAIAEHSVKSVTFMWDGGTKAVKAAFKTAIELASRLPIKVKVAVLPNEKDPNEVAPEVILKAIAQSVDATKLNYMKVMAKLRQALA